MLLTETVYCSQLYGNSFAIVQSTVSDLLKDSNLPWLEWKSPGSSSSFEILPVSGLEPLSLGMGTWNAASRPAWPILQYTFSKLIGSYLYFPLLKKLHLETKQKNVFLLNRVLVWKFTKNAHICWLVYKCNFCNFLSLNFCGFDPGLGAGSR